MPAPVLSLIHQANAGSGVFGDVVRERGWQLDERCIPTGDPAPELERFAAVLVFGGSANVDEAEVRPWLRTERALLERALELDTPVFGVCLGAQQLAQAAGACVGRNGSFEIGWRPVHATDEARRDPVLGGLPPTMRACEWHGYGFDLPPGAVPLYGNESGVQAFRIGTRQWGIQFHAEVTGETFAGWAGDEQGRTEAQAAGIDLEELAAETAVLIDDWNELGRGLCRRFLDVAAAGPPG